MMGFVESYCEAALLRQRNRPTCRDGAALPVDHFDLVLGYVIRIEPLTGWFNHHGIERRSVDFHLIEFFAGCRIDDAQHSIIHSGIAAAIHYEEIFGHRIEGDRVCIHQQFHALDQFIRFSVIDLSFSRPPVSYVKAAQILAIEQGMWNLDSLNSVNQPVCLQVKTVYRFGP